MLVFDVGVAIPRLHFTVPCLYEPYSAFHQAPCNEQLTILWPFSIKFKDVLGFLRNVKCITGFRLHSKRKFKGFQSRFNGFLARSLLEMLAIEVLQQCKLSRLLLLTESLVLEVIDQLGDIGFGCIHASPLKSPRQKRGSPIPSTSDG